MRLPFTNERSAPKNSDEMVEGVCLNCVMSFTYDLWPLEAYVATGAAKLKAGR